MFQGNAFQHVNSNILAIMFDLGVLREIETSLD